MCYFAVINCSKVYQMKRNLLIVLNLVGLSFGLMASDFSLVVKQKAPEYILCVHGSVLETKIALIRTVDKKVIQLSYKDAVAVDDLSLQGAAPDQRFEAAIDQVFGDFFENVEAKIENNKVSIKNILSKTLIYAGFSGIGTPDRQKVVADALRQQCSEVPADVIITSDVALLKNIDDQGIFLIADAGSIVYRKLEGHPEARAGGHSVFLGSDEGSCVDIGLKAFLVAVDFENGVLRTTNLGLKFKDSCIKAFFDAIKASIPSQKQTLLDVRYEIIADMKQGKFKKLVDIFDVVFKLAYENNNTVALYVVEKAAKELGERLADLTFDKKLPRNFPLFLYGSVFKSPRWEIYLAGVLGKKLHGKFKIHNVATQNIALQAVLHQLKD